MGSNAAASQVLIVVDGANNGSAFDVWANLVLPGFLGTVTLVVAIASWRVARASHRLAESIVADRSAKEKENLRLSLTEKVHTWSATRWNAARPKVEESARRSAELSSLSVALCESGIPGSQELQDFLWTLDKVKVPSSADPIQYDFVLAAVGGRFARLTELAVLMWHRDPENLEAFTKKLEETIEKLVEDSITYAASQAEGFRKLIKDEEGEKSRQDPKE